MADTDTEDESDEYENAVEDVEIDQSSELYKTIVAAIIEDNQSLDNSMVDDAFVSQDPIELTNEHLDGGKLEEKTNEDECDPVQSEHEQKSDITITTTEPVEDVVHNVHVLLGEAAEDVSKR